MEKDNNSETDNLFHLQFMIKTDKINQQRRSVEVTKLFQTYNEQIQKLLISLYTAAKGTWFLINNCTEDAKNALQGNYSAKIIQSSEATTDLSNNLLKLKSDPKRFLELYQKDDNGLSIDALLAIHSLFYFCWCEEETDLFADFMKKVDKKDIKAFSQVFLTNPLIHNYFKAALNPVFKEIQMLTKSNDIGLLNSLFESLKSFSPLIPNFLHHIIMRNNGDLLFYEILRQFILNFAVFGIADLEVYLYHNSQIQNLLTLLNDSFSNGKFTNFVKSLALKDNSCCVVPKEQLIQEFFDDYQKLVLIDKKCFPDFKAPSNLCFVPFSTSSESKEQKDNQDDSLVKVVYNFLAKANLVKLQKKANGQTIEYFKTLAELSSSFKDPELELEIDKLSIILEKQPISISRLIKMVEDNFHKYHGKHLTTTDPLLEVSSYNTQYQYISKILGLVEDFKTKSLNYIDMKTILKLTENVIYPTADEARSNPKIFADFFMKNAEKLTNENKSLFSSPISYKILFSIFSYKLNLFQNDDMLDLLDEKIHDLIIDKKANLTQHMNDDKFLLPYLHDPNRLKLYTDEFNSAFSTDLPFARIDRIIRASVILNQILIIDGIKEAGADQIIPVSVLGIVYANPKGLTSTFLFIQNYLNFILETKFSPFDKVDEYTLTQFSAIYSKYIYEKINAI